MRWMSVAFLICSSAMAAEYPVAFLAHPRTSGWFFTQSVSEQYGGYVHNPGTDLVLMHPDGSEQILVVGEQPASGMIAVQDFCVDLDGQSIIYSHIHTIPNGVGLWCDLYRVAIATGEITQLTHAISEWNPPRGANQYSTEIPPTQQIQGQWRSGRGLHFQTVWNIGPCVVGDGSIVFCSNRQGMAPPVDSGPGYQLFRMSSDGRHVRLIGHMNLAGGLHPAITRKGKILFSSAEQQGVRTSNGNGWSIWSMNPDGSDWGPEISAIGQATPTHFQCESSDGTLVASQYYDTRMYGMLVCAPPFVATPFGPPTMFGSPLYQSEPGIRMDGTTANYAYKRRGFFSPLPWAFFVDRENVNAAGEKPGMVSHPAAAPNNGILLTWTGDNGDAAMDLGVYAIPDVRSPIEHHSGLIPVIDREDRHEWMARPVIPFSEIYGLSAPPVPEAPRADDLPPGSPFAVVSTSSMSWPEVVKPSFERAVMDNFTLEQTQYIRVLAFNKTTSYDAFNFYRATTAAGGNENADGFNSAYNERTGAYDDVPLWKYRQLDGGVHYGPNPPAGSVPILDPEGKPDTSFRIQIPADQPWTFQVLDAKKQAVATAQTWHQLIPGEHRTCGGCHTHHGKVPFPFEASFAATPEYETRRLDAIRIATYDRDIKPIVDRTGVAINRLGWTQGLKWYNSDETAVDDDPRLTSSDAEMIRLWIDTGMMSEGKYRNYKKLAGVVERTVTETDKIGPFADSQGPTVAHAVFADQVILGLFDPQSGIDISSLSVTCTSPMAGRSAGAQLADLFVRDEHRWILTATMPLGADMTVSVRDLQVGKNLYGEDVGPGNLTRITFPLTAGAEPPDPPDNSAEIARLQAEIAELDEQIADAQANLDAMISDRAALQSQLDNLLDGE